VKLFIVLIIAAGCLLLVILALPFLVDLTPYQDQYRPMLEEALNRKVSIQAIHLTIVPRLGIRAEEVTVMDDPRFNTASFASLKSLDIGVKLWPLLQQRIEVEEVVLHDPQITIVKDANGVLNVSTLGNHGGRPGPSAERPSSLLGLLAVDTMSLKGGKLTYTDRTSQPPKEYELANLEVIVRSVKVGQVAGLHIATLVQPYDLPVTIDGSFGPVQDKLALDDIDFALRTGGVVSNLKGSLVAGLLKLETTAQFINSADLPESLAPAKPLKVHNLDILVETPYPQKDGVPIQDQITQAKLEFDLELGNSTLIVAGSGNKGDFRLIATADSIYTTDLPMTLPLAKSIQIKDLKFEADAKYPAGQGKDILDPLNVRTLEFDVVMGNSILTIKGAGPTTDFKLTATSEMIKSTDLPLETPGKKSIDIKDVRLAVEVHRPVIQVTSLTFSPSGGDIQAAAVATTNVTPMPFEASMMIRGVPLAPVMEAFSNSPVWLSGMTSAQLSIKGTARSYADFTRTLTGTGRVIAKDGALEGINLLKEAGGLGRTVGLADDPSHATVFDQLDTTFHMDAGLIYVDRFLLQSRMLEASATGTIGFDQALNLKTKLTASGKRVSVPMLIAGTLQSPIYSLDANAAIGAGLRKLQQGAAEVIKGDKKPDELVTQGRSSPREQLEP